LVDDFGDGLTGVLQRLGEDLIPALGEVVIDRAAGSAAAGQHFVDRDACGAAFPQHFGGADQHAGAGGPALGGLGHGGGGRQNNLQRV
jgi:hypothetical protein